MHNKGQGSFGCVYLVFHQEEGVVATKIMKPEKFDKREWDAAIQLTKQGKNIYVLQYLSYSPQNSYVKMFMKYANMKTLSSIIENTDKFLPLYINRALMKQILEGMRVFHIAGLIHRDIKCDNILLHCPPGSGRVHAKISDFGFAKKENVNIIDIQHQSLDMFINPP
ncbi:MAG: hypothetical protein EZS28_017175 [Streblomastix strix]|uniref:Protein kinase domain-containing protein n=1 Tax=Streblomastix strix TaxID=222440 RepID=A0A5J4VYH2_9EUKA|nr:MAG: hypothetical protein EZS28_017175 [Streblomastix strix]